MGISNLRLIKHLSNIGSPSEWKSKKKEITRLKAKKVIFLDSERATSKAVEDELRKSDGFPIQRIGRKGLYGTVTKIAKDPLSRTQFPYPAIYHQRTLSLLQ
jgi:putative cell wall-binding protein